MTALLGKIHTVISYLSNLCKLRIKAIRTISSYGYRQWCN